MEKVNPNGGAIAPGHPVGATGCFLTTKAVHKLHRTDGEYGLMAMCCGGGLGTGTLIQKIWYSESRQAAAVSLRAEVTLRP
jgi:acetyl-CoA C-acetyltransferase